MGVHSMKNKEGGIHTGQYLVNKKRKCVKGNKRKREKEKVLKN